jgi:hypothetical protein
MSCKTCPVCGANWVDNQLFWKTGKSGSDADLNALVCRSLTGEKAKNCANPAKGTEGGVGWAERLKNIEQGLDGL